MQLSSLENRSEYRHVEYRGGVTQPTTALKAKASAQRYATIDAMSVFYLLTKM